MRFELRLQSNYLTILLGLNLVIFILAIIFRSFIGFDTNVFYLFGGLIPDRVFAGDLWLLLTSAFFHLDILHFIFNFYALLRIGQVVVNFYSDRTLLFTYVLGALGGSLLSILSGSGSLSLGASGGIFALVGLLLGGSLKRYRYGFNLPFSFLDILPVIIFSFWIGIVPGSRINNWAHMGGLLVGVVLGFLVKHSLGAYKSNLEKNLEDLLYYFSLVILIGSFAALIYNALSLIFI